MKLGTASTVITPPIGTPLAGFSSRDHGSEGILDELETQVFWFEDDNQPDRHACIITADLVGFDTQLTAEIKEALGSRHLIPPERIMLCASHTHSGPQVCHNMLGVGQLVPAVVDSIRSSILSAVDQARGKIRLVTLECSNSQLVGYGINRRLLRNGHAEFLPNPHGIHDDEVSTLTFRDQVTREVIAVLFHFTCHPSNMGDYRITADYPGYARRYIGGILGSSATAGFLPGCFGDIRANCTYMGGAQFRRGMPEDNQAFGTALGNAVLAAINNPNHICNPESVSTLDGQIAWINLPFVQLPDRTYLEQVQATGTADTQRWATYLLSPTVTPVAPLCIQRITLTKDVILISMGGEVVCDYGLYIKKADPHHLVLPLAYTNGLVGYIPSEHMFQEGGYEVQDSIYYYGLPAQFDPRIEKQITAVIDRLLAV